MRDEDVPAVVRSLGVPGIADIHVHAMPQRLLDAIWGVFDSAEEVYGTTWPIRYRTSDRERRSTLAALGVRRYTSLNYAHRPGMAADLNRWSRDYAQQHPKVIHSATFYPEPAAPGYVAEAVAQGARVFKLHVDVGGIDLADPLLDPVWGVLQDADACVVGHVGSAPRPGPFTGAAPVERLLGRFPRLNLVIAHLGLPETAEFIALARRFPTVGFDTTMVGTDFMSRAWPVPDELMPLIRDLGMQGRIYFGSDFPNIPYAYAHQLAALQRWNLGDEWMRQVLWEAAARRFPS